MIVRSNFFLNKLTPEPCLTVLFYIDNHKRRTITCFYPFRKNCYYLSHYQFVSGDKLCG